MKVLAIDTSTNALSVSLWDEGLVASTLLQTKRQHGAMLAPVVDQLLKQAGWNANQLEEIIVGVGPGSFTGLRIGVTFAKMWAVGKNIPVKVVSSLAIIAATAQAISGKDLIIPVMDARRGTAYTSVYTLSEKGTLVEEVKDSHVEWDEWLSEVILPMLDSLDIERILIVGNQIDLFKESLQEKSEVEVILLDGWQHYPHTEQAFLQASSLVKKVEDANTLAPNYAHATLAEQQWAEKSNKDLENNEEENKAYVDITGLDE